ncbi:MAG TPA: sigma-70 family RNA polymerase sigma factor [Ktedonobacterales bacterium]|jgi:RNA polymerase sigma-70 factor (ECF subfamily)|nr:sigma-70 family RNA polymerase sigma factor [Ktedonobacterales bacterium]
MALAQTWTARLAHAGARQSQTLPGWLRWLAVSSRFEPPAIPHAHRPGLADTTGRDGIVDDFDAFVGAHEGQIFGYLWRMTGDEQTAYDLAQEAFLRAWQHFDRIRGYERPKAWLFRVATNLALNHLRHRATALGTTTALDVDESLTQSDPALAVAERDLVRLTLLALPPNQRAALVLREVSGLSCAEVGRALGISPAAAKMLLFRARERFRAGYTRQEDAP